MKEPASAYDLLGVDKGATAAEIRKAYLKLAIQLHPDKSPDDQEAAKERFQSLQKVYAILSNDEKRKVYDQTGSLDDSEVLTSEQFNNLYEYYKAQFAPVTEESIKDFESGYRGSEEEKADVLRYYEQFEGNMDQAFEWILLSDPCKDSHRFMDIVEDGIQNKVVAKYDSFTIWSRKISKKPRPKTEDILREKNDHSGVTSKAQRGAKRKNAKSKKSDDRSPSELVHILQARRNARNSQLEAFAAKYGVSMADGLEEPTEEEFQAARQRIHKKKRTPSSID